MSGENRRRFYVAAVRYGVSLLLTFLLGCILIMAQGENPMVALREIFYGAFGTLPNFGTTLRWTTPSLLVGAAAVVAFRSGVMNLGIEGQMYFGAFAAGIAGYTLALPHVAHILVCFVVGGLVGAAYAVIPGLMRLYFNISELISSLMLNFLAALFTEYYVRWVIMGGLQGDNGSLSISTQPVLPTAELTPLVKGTTASTGIFVALAVLIFLWFMYRFTVKGYELNQMGRNMRFARQGGVNVARNFMLVIMASGLIAGLCGAVEVTGSYHRFTPNFSKNMGWDGIMITRIAANNPVAVIVVSLLWGALKAGSLHMERVTSLNRLVVNIIQMLFVLFVAIDYEGLYSRWRKKKLAERAVQKEVTEA